MQIATHHPTRLLLTTLLAAASACVAIAQAPRPAPVAPTVPPAPATAPLPARDFPKPSFPATAPRQSQFTVDFVYRYLESAYTPAVPIHTLPKAVNTSDTPEHAFITQISAATALDYEWWLAGWDTQSQQLLRQDATSMKHDAAFWKQLWQRAFQGREITLVKRLEAAQYVILEFRIGPKPAAGQPDPLLYGVFRQQGSTWVATRALDESGFFPAAARNDTAPRQAQFEAIPAFTGQTTNFTEPQKLFFRNEPRGAESATLTVW